MEKIFLILHGISLLFLLFTVLLAYIMGLTWIYGKSETLDEKRVATYHRHAWVGIILMVITGTGAAFTHYTEFLAKWQFITKIILIVILIANCIAIGNLMKVASKQSYKTLSPLKKRAILTSATIATICWAGILLMAMFIGIDK